MEQSVMRKSAMALAVSAAFAAGSVDAANLAGNLTAAAGQFFAPQRTLGTPTLSLGRHTRLVVPAATTLTANAGDVLLLAGYFDAAGKLTGTQIIGVDATGGGANYSTIGLGVALGAGGFLEGDAVGATKAGLFFLATADDFGGDTKKVGISSGFGAPTLDTNMAVNITTSTNLLQNANTYTAGDLGAIGGATTTLGAEVLAAAITLDTTYVGPVITSATQTGTTGGINFATNVGLNITSFPGLESFANAGLASVKNSVDTLSVLDGSLVDVDVFVGTGGGTPAALTDGVRGFLLGASATGVNAAGAVTPFATGVNRVTFLSSSNTLVDLAGNQNTGVNQAVYTNYTSAAPALAAGAGKLVVTARAGGAVVSATDLWRTSITKVGETTGTMSVAVRFAEQNNAAAIFGAIGADSIAAKDVDGTTTKAITLTPAALTGTNAVIDSITGTGLDVTAVLNVTNMVANAPAAEFGLNKDTGALVVTFDNWATQANVQLGFNPVAATTGAGKLTSNAGSQQLAASITAADIFAGPNATTLPARKIFTLDSDKEGFLDGFTLDGQGAPFAGTVASPLAAGHGVNLNSVNKTAVEFASTPTLRNNADGVAARLEIVLTNKSASGEDWDGDGTKGDGDDIFLYQTGAPTGIASMKSFSTGATTIGAGPGATHPEILFNPRADGLFIATPPSSPLSYNGIFRVTDGSKLPVNNTAATATLAPGLVALDGAPPVLLAGSYRSEANAGKSNEFGNITFTFSEVVGPNGGFNPTAGEIYIDGRPLSLQALNADATPAGQEAKLSDIFGGTPPSIFGDDTFVGENAPFNLKDDPDATSTKTIIGAAITFPLGTKINIIDGVGLEAITTAAIGGVAVAKFVDPGLRMTGAHVVSTFVQGSRIPNVIVTFSRDVARSNGGIGSDLDGLFTVRADVGQDQGTGVDTYFFDIRGADTFVGTDIGNLGTAAEVTLIMPPNSLPANTTAMYVDYRALTNTITTEKFAVVRADTASIGSEVETIIFDKAGAPTGPGPGLSATPDNDDNTQKVTLASGLAFQPLQTGQPGDPTNNLFTMTIYGTAKRGANDLPGKTGIRADLVKLANQVTPAVFADPGVVAGAGTVVIRRNAADPTGGTDARSGTGSQLTVIQELALLNKCVTLQDLNQLLTDRSNYLSKASAVQAALGNGTSSAQVDQLRTAAFTAANPLRGPLGFTSPAPDTDTSTSVPGLSSGSRGCFIEVTTGTGGAGTGAPEASGNNQNAGQSDDNAVGNNQASVGRTATMFSSLPNTVKNGTTTYAVSVNFGNGNITARDSNSNTTDAAIVSGNVGIRLPVQAAAARNTSRLQVLDTAFARVANGKYQVIVGADSKSLNAASTTVEPNATAADTFVLISVKDPASGDYVLTNSAESSFLNFTPFTADLFRGTPPNGLSVLRNVDPDLVSVSSYDATSSNWHLLGIKGNPNRTVGTTLSPIRVDMPRMFVSIRSDDGRPVTHWLLDANNDQAFTMGGGAGVKNTPVLAPNAVQLAYTLSGGIDKSKTIALVPGAGLAYRNLGSLGSLQDEGDADTFLNEAFTGNNNFAGNAPFGSNTYRLYVPITSDPVGNRTTTVKGWHLITSQAAETLSAFVARNATAQAVVIPIAGVTTPNSGAFAWFRDNEPVVSSYNLSVGQALFVYLLPAGTPASAALDFTP